MSRVLLIDLSSGYFPPSLKYRDLCLARLKAQSLIKQARNPDLNKRGVATYSRGLLRIGACLEEAGHTVMYRHYGFVDQAQVFASLREELANLEFEVIAVNCVTPTFPKAIAIIREAKRLDSKLLTVLGGHHATYLADDIITGYAPVVDVVVRGEGEMSMVEICNHPHQLPDIKGISYLLKRQQAGPFSCRCNPERVPYDLERLPMPAYHLLPYPLDCYAHNVTTSRGCVFRCTYCVDGWYFPGLRHSPAEIVVDELRYLSSRLPEGTLVHFCDSIFDIDLAYSKRLLKAVIAADTHLCFSCDLRAGTVTRESIELMKTAGFIQYCIGIESSDDLLLATHKQSQRVNESVEACQLIRKVDPQAFIIAYWITGLPGTTSSSLEQDSIAITQLVRNNIVDVVGNKIFVPYPGTPIFKNAEAYGMFVRHNDWSKYLRQCEPVYDLPELTAEDLSELYMVQEQALLDTYCDVWGMQVQDLACVNVGDHLYHQFFDPTLSEL
jgi:anaerobic magnesium-protoporphyrin IX monomethyl ester cyclase